MRVITFFLAQNCVIYRPFWQMWHPHFRMLWSFGLWFVLSYDACLNSSRAKVLRPNSSSSFNRLAYHRRCSTRCLVRPSQTSLRCHRWRHWPRRRLPPATASLPARPSSLSSNASWRATKRSQVALSSCNNINNCNNCNNCNSSDNNVCRVRRRIWSEARPLDRTQFCRHLQFLPLVRNFAILLIAQ